MRRPDPKQAVVDSGYTNAATVVAVTERGVDLIGSWHERGAKRPNYGIDPAYASSQFHYDADLNEMICPEDKRLRQRTVRKLSEWVRVITYRTARSDCSACPKRKLCSPKNSMRKHGRSVTRRIVHEIVTAFKQKMQTEEAKQIYKQRAPVAEFPNAWIKTKLNFTRFRCRGLEKATAEATWAALTFNLQRFFKLMPEWRTALAVG